MEKPASRFTVTWCNGPLVNEMHWPTQEHFAWIVPVLFDLIQLHLSVNSISLRFSELAARAQAVSRPSAFPQCSKRDEAAVCHVYGGLSAWQGVRHSLGSTPCIQAAASSTCSPILLSGSSTGALRLQLHPCLHCPASWNMVFNKEHGKWLLQPQ